MLPNGLDKFQEIHLRLCNAADLFQRLMQRALTGLFLKHFIICPDGILV